MDFRPYGKKIFFLFFLSYVIILIVYFPQILPKEVPSLKRTIALLLLAAVLLSLGGCSIMEGNISTLLKVPQPNKVQQQLRNAIDSSLGTNIKYISPAAGNHRTSLIQVDLDGSGRLETVLFYLPTADNTTAFLAVLTEQDDGTWKLVKKIQGAAAAVDYVEFSDLNSDGKRDILVGWSRGDSARELFVYNVFASDDALLYTDGYNESRFFTDTDGAPLLFTASFDKALGSGTAKIVTLDKNGELTKTFTCEIDAHFDTVTAVSYSRISSTTRAIILDARLGNTAVTQFLFFDGNRLINPYYTDGLLDPAFIRETAFACTDIDKDGIVELPAASALPVVTGASSGYTPMQLTAWSTFNSSTLTNFTLQPLTYEFSCIMNPTLGYYYIYPAAWAGRVSVYNNAADRTMYFYHVDPQTNYSTQLFSISRISAADYNKRANTGSWFELHREGEQIYAIHIADNLSADLKLLIGTVTDCRNRLILY